MGLNWNNKVKAIKSTLKRSLIMKEKTKSMILLFVISLVLIPSFIYGASANRPESMKQENVKKILTAIKVNPDQVEIPQGSDESVLRQAIKVTAYYRKVKEPVVVTDYVTNYDKVKDKTGTQKVTIKYTEEGCTKKAVVCVVLCKPVEETPRPTTPPETPKPTTTPPQSSIEDADINFPYVSGYVDGTFKPNQAVTREELATMMARLITKNRIPNENNQFKDLPESRFSTDAINYITKLGIMKPTASDTFNPYGTVSYKEFQEIVNQLKPYIKDESVTLPEGNGELTRAQAVVAFNQLFNVQCNTSYTESPFTDVTEKTPDYKEILCATVPRAEPRR